MNQVESVAAMFSAVLREWLTDEEMDEVVLHNANELKDSDCCASHDFCDANMAMDEAFKQCGLRTNIDFPGWEAYADGGHPADESEIIAAGKLWNDAWTLAKANNFRK